MKNNQLLHSADEVTGPFVVYWNTKNRHAKVHIAGCSHIGKNGGNHKDGQGGYAGHLTYEAATRYAEATGLPDSDCLVCKPAERMPELADDTSVSLPGEELETPLFEGAVRKVLVNAYERSRKARTRCIEKYGPCCFICGFSFSERYGEVASEFIHVHHLRELSEIDAEYEVDPIRDLRPVCPNCHAVLHLRKPAFSIKDVMGFLREKCPNRHGPTDGT